MVIGGLSPAQSGRGVSVHACREPIHRFVSLNARDLARRKYKTRPDDSGRGKAGASRHVGGLGSEEIPNLFKRSRLGWCSNLEQTALLADIRRPGRAQLDGHTR